MCKLISCVGYGGTGSSAATNIIEEFSTVKSLGYEEFSFAASPDGIADLENALIEGNFLKTDLAVKRFLKLMRELNQLPEYRTHFQGKFYTLAKEYINSVVEIQWTGWLPRGLETENLSTEDRDRINLARKVYRFLVRNREYELYEPYPWRPDYYPRNTLFYSHFFTDAQKEDFLRKTREFTSRLINAETNNEHYQYILMDQSLPSISAYHYMRYFNDPTIVIVDRDPRDLYTINKATWGEGWIPSQSVDQFIEWYKLTRGSRERELKSSYRIVFFQFESFVYEYEATLKGLMDFLDLTENDHKDKFKEFNPRLSKKNTHVFKQYPDLADDIKEIEKCLPQYLYPFPSGGGGGVIYK